MGFAATTRKSFPGGPKRRGPRMPAALRVNVQGIDSEGNRFDQLASTMDISLSGARITGLAAKVNQGDTVIVQAGEARSLFKVSWIAGNQDGTYQMGVHCLKSEKCPWHDWLMVRMKQEGERSGRLPCTGTARLHPASFPDPILGRLRNIDGDGCFVQCVTESPLAGTMRGQFVIDGLRFDAVVAVRDSLPKIGVRLQWCDLGGDGRENLLVILRELKQRQMMELSGAEDANS
jgi:hypothetical protein